MRNCLAISLAAALALPALAQTRAALETEPPASAPPTIRRLVSEVQMVFSAQDHRGHPLPKLGAPQIRVLDNGVPAPLTSFQVADGLPLKVALLLDGSDSMRAGFTAQRQAALAFVRRLQRSGCDQIFSMEFGVRAAVSNTDSPDGTLPARPIGGQTALYDALLAASAMLHSRAPARRVLLLLSDGDDNYSRASLADALTALQQANVMVYSITVHSPRREYPGDRVLRQIAAVTGGRAFLLRNYRQASGVLPQIENDLRAQYMVGFRPAGGPAAGEFHSVKILALPTGTVVRARPGYYIGSQN